MRRKSAVTVVARAVVLAVVPAVVLTGCVSAEAPRTAAPAARPSPTTPTQATQATQATGVPQEVERRVVLALRPVPPEPPAPPKPPPLQPGPTLYGPGDRGPEVREIQARLRQIAWFSGDVSDFYGDQTRAAVAGFQGKRGFPVTGAVDRRTLDRLVGMSTEPSADELHNVEPDPADGAPLDPRCLTGRVICIDKTSSSLRWVVDGDVEMTLDARFGSSDHPTRDGLFHVYFKDIDHVSHLYESSMPYSMFFSGGEAVHYSSDFAAVGYAGASHGCVNIRDYDAIASLYSQVRVGDPVVVYWS
jgi:hypothetical protein